MYNYYPNNNNQEEIGNMQNGAAPGDLEFLYYTYKVQQGDSLYKIANQFGTTIEDIMKINNLQSDMLLLGQTLYIPRTGLVEKFVEELQTQPTPEIFTFDYITKPGDTLFKIAFNTQSTLQDILKNNDLQSLELVEGQQLKIPIKKQVITDDSTIAELLEYLNISAVDFIKILQAGFESAVNIKFDIEI